MRPEATHADVVIVGGGPAGAATAWALARNGVQVLIVDRAFFPHPKPCGERLSPPAWRQLADMGLTARLEAAGAATIDGMQMVSPSGIGFRGTLPEPMRALPRDLLDPLLLDAARTAGAQVLEGALAHDLMFDAEDRVVGVHLRNTPELLTDEPAEGRTISARIVVGADGVRSMVARRLGLAYVRKRPRRVAFVTRFHGVAGMGRDHETVAFADGYCALASVGDGVTNVAVVVPQSAVHHAAIDPEEFLATWLERHPALGARLVDAERVAPVLVTGPFASHARRAWAPGAALVGDAADFHDPFLSDGIHAALRGGAMLAPYLFEALRAPTPQRADHALAAYDRSRRHAFADATRLERRLGLAIEYPALFDRVARSVQGEQALADLVVGVASGCRPPQALWRPGVLWRLLRPSTRRRGTT